MTGTVSMKKSGSLTARLVSESPVETGGTTLCDDAVHDPGETIVLTWGSAGQFSDRMMNTAAAHCAGTMTITIHDSKGPATGQIVLPVPPGTALRGDAGGE